IVLSTLALSGSSAVITTGGGVIDKLLVTDFTPLTPLAAVSAAVFVASSFTSPESVTTPSFTLVETVEGPAFAAIALSTAVLTSASDVFELQDVVETIKKSAGTANISIILLLIVDLFNK